jgi:hypothetical protein
MICEACNKNESIGVCCVPGVPVSCAYCKDCLKNNNHPMPILIANTVCCGGLEHCADWWKEMVIQSLQHQNKTIEWFNSEVEKELEKENGNYSKI